MIRTAIFSGSFNPIHIGHLMLANYVTEYESVDECWFVLTPQNPLKQQSDLSDDRLRMEMLHLALADYPKFKACDIELSMPKPSYTIYTLEKLKEQYPDREFILLIGADNWQIFDQWKEYRRIIDEFSVWVYPRPNVTLLYDRLTSHVRIIDSPVFDISSSKIRKAFSEGKELKAFLPLSIFDFIKEKKMYF